MRTLLVFSLLALAACQENRPQYNDLDPHLRLMTLEGQWQEESTERQASNKRTVSVYTMTWIGEIPTMEQLKPIKRIVCKGNPALSRLYTPFSNVLVSYGDVKANLEEFKKRNPDTTVPVSVTMPYTFAVALFAPSSNRIDSETVDMYVDGSLLSEGRKALDAAVKSQKIEVVSEQYWLEYTYIENKDDQNSLMGRILIPFK